MSMKIETVLMIILNKRPQHCPYFLKIANLRIKFLFIAFIFYFKNHVCCILVFQLLEVYIDANLSQ